MDFQDYLVELTKKKDVILTGDLNVAHKEIDIFNPKANLKTPGFTIEERDSFGKFLGKGFVDTFRNLWPDEVKYSFFSAKSQAKKENRGWRLDYFVVNEAAMDRVLESDILNEYDGSDHDPIWMKWRN